jgi:2-aminoethylphosphonate-pyruvate transaminase
MAGARDARFTHVAIVHHETTTGRLNDLLPWCAVPAHGVSLLVDGVSSFGAEAIDFADSSLAAVAATANKCLHGVPGASFVIVRRSALAQAASRTYYLDLGRLARAAGSARYARSHRRCTRTMRWSKHCANMPNRAGVRLATNTMRRSPNKYALDWGGSGLKWSYRREQSSVVLHAYRLPAGIGYAALHDGLKAEGFVIYAGQGELAKTLFRIAVMGNLVAADIDRLLKCIARLLA